MLKYHQIKCTRTVQPNDKKNYLMHAQTRNIQSYLMPLNNNLYAQEVGLATGARTSSLLAEYFSF